MVWSKVAPFLSVIKMIIFVLLRKKSFGSHGNFYVFFPLPGLSRVCSTSRWAPGWPARPGTAPRLAEGGGCFQASAER